MENAIVKKSFVFNSVKIRTAIIDGEPWFVAKDVCAVLGMGTEQIRRIPESQKGLHQTQTPGGIQNLSIISEAGLYRLVLRSDKPAAEPFIDWVTSEVLPTIRKTGRYGNVPKLPQNYEEALEELLKAVKAERMLKEKNQKLVTENTSLRKKNFTQGMTIAHNKPKVLFADAVSASNTSILVGDLAKILKQNGVNTGQNRLFEWMRENGYLIKKGRADYNMPTQKSMNAGLFEIKESVVNNPDGSIRVTKTPKVTGTGQVFFINQFLRSKKVILP